MTLLAFKSEWVIKRKHNRNWEFISCLACVLAIRKAISLVLVYKGALKDLMDIWIKDVNEYLGCYFASLANR